MARHDGKVLAVIGASEFQEPLIARAQELGCTVHAFAWECGDVGERVADVFHPISTAEHEDVLRVCADVGVDGVCTIGSDFNNICAAWVANRLGLCANTDECVRLSTNKRAMREAFAAAGDPSPASRAVRPGDDVEGLAQGLAYPVIAKPADRSGSRGITKVERPGDLRGAIEAAWEESFSQIALVEDFLEGDEFSVECLSWQGVHRVLQVTRKFTTGAPGFVETAHLQPPLIDDATYLRIERVVCRALDTLGVRVGAAHAEVKVNDAGEPKIVEIGSRMGGDFIGSDLVPLSTGLDYVGAVVDVALGCEPRMVFAPRPRAAAVRFVLQPRDAEVLDRLRQERPELVVHGSWTRPSGGRVSDSSARFGHCVMVADSADELLPWLPDAGASLADMASRAGATVFAGQAEEDAR